jgi:hypothetical protein
VEQTQDLIDKWFMLAGLLHDKMPPTLLCDFYEGIAGHILHPC